MIQRGAMFPAPDELAELGRLEGPLDIVYDDISVTMADGNTDLSLHVEYYDMRFRFEFFALRLCGKLSKKEAKQFHVESWDRMAGIFRFEWLRHARPEEFLPNKPSTWKFRQGTGRRQDVPDSAFSIAVSMVGVVFYAEPEPLLCITDDSMPTLVRVLLPGEELNDTLASGDCVPLESIPSWIADLQGNDPALRFKDVNSEEFQREKP